MHTYMYMQKNTYCGLQPVVGVLFFGAVVGENQAHNVDIERLCKEKKKKYRRTLVLFRVKMKMTV